MMSYDGIPQNEVHNYGINGSPKLLGSTRYAVEVATMAENIELVSTWPMACAMETARTIFVSRRIGSGNKQIKQPQPAHIIISHSNRCRISCCSLANRHCGHYTAAMVYKQTQTATNVYTANECHLSGSGSRLQPQGERCGKFSADHDSIYVKGVLFYARTVNHRTIVRTFLIVYAVLLLSLSSGHSVLRLFTPFQSKTHTGKT